MQPQNPSPLPGGYEFLQEAPAKRKMAFGGPSKQKRMIIVAAGALLLIVIAFIIFGVLQNANKPKTDLLVRVLQRQQELIRVAELGAQKSKGTDALGYSNTVKQTVQSDQSSLLAVVKKSGLKVSEKTLMAGANPKNDQALTAAEQAGRLDETVTEVLQSLVTEYQVQLQSAYQGNPGKNTRAALTSAFENSKLLLPIQTGEPKK